MRKFFSHIVMAAAFIGSFLGLPTRAEAQGNRPAPQVSVVFQLAGFDSHAGFRKLSEIGVEYRLNNAFHVSASLMRGEERGLLSSIGLGLETNGRRFWGAGAEGSLVFGVWKNSQPLTPLFTGYGRFGRRSGFNTRLNMTLYPDSAEYAPSVIGLSARKAP